MENLPQEQRKQRLIQSKPSEKGEIITYLSRMGDVLDDVPKRGKLVVALLTVHSIVDSNKVNIVLREHDLSIHSHLQVVTAQTGHILDNDPLDKAGFDIRNHLLEARAVERCTRNAVINIKAIVFVAVVKCIALKDLFLVDDTVAVALQFIVTR